MGGTPPTTTVKDSEMTKYYKCDCCKHIFEEDEIENDAENNSATTESSSEPVEEVSRKISLRLAQAIINSTK